MRPAQFTCIDLFAGCGGLSLGLERAGFRPLLFCELSDHAAETYTHNNPGVPRFKDAVKLAEDLRKKAEDKPISLQSADGQNVEIVPRDIDLVCGGPPCQGYSRIGHRRTHKLQKNEIPSNHLFKSMVKIIAATRPKVFLFENVSGILSGKWTSQGKEGEIFKNVLLGARGFGGLMVDEERPKGVERRMAADCYVVRWLEIKSYDYGVPQNRPRVLVVGVRDDVAGEEIPRLGSHARCVEDLRDNSNRLIPPPQGRYSHTPAQILSDLAGLPRSKPDKSSAFEYSRVRDKGRSAEMEDELRDWYLATRDRWMAGVGADLKDLPFLANQEYSKHSERVVERFKLIRGQGLTMAQLNKIGKGTKKFSQRALSWTSASGPNITVTSLPDDLVHFSEDRILTVREWARLQTFPDWFVFKGPRTTGGSRRAGDPSKGNWHRDVPQYTQIGNAVPVALAYALGAHFRTLLGGHK